MKLLDQLNLPELEDQNIIVSYSGGYDSTIMLYALVKKYGKDKIKALSFDYGQKHPVELLMAKKNTAKLGVDHEIVDITFLKDMYSGVSSLIGGSLIDIPTVDEVAGDPQPSSYIPNRNMIMLSISAGYAEANNGRYIVLSNNATDLYGYHDATPEFTDRINDVLSLNRKNQISLLSPFKDMYKDEEGLLAKELSVDYNFDILENHWSCYNGDDGSHKECGFVGNCPTCREKMTGMAQAGYDKQYLMHRFQGRPEDFDTLYEDKGNK